LEIPQPQIILNHFCFEDLNYYYYDNSLLFR
jgi:hypothetical protein